MKILGKHKIANFIAKKPSTQNQVSSWVYEAEDADWGDEDDIGSRYSDAMIQSGNLITFYLRRINCGIMVKISYLARIIAIKDVFSTTE